MGRKVGVFIFSAVALATAVYFGGFWSGDREPMSYGDGWWGKGNRPAAGDEEADTSVRQFRISVDDSVLSDLQARLNRSRLFESLEGTKFHYGFNSGYLKEVLEYWRHSYDWREQERYLNQYDHFLTNIEGIDIHFIRVKPKVANAERSKVALMVNGWGSSFVAFYKLIPVLTDPLNHGGTEDDAFELIIPSIPGFGLSEAPHHKGHDCYETARIFDKLMVRLGFDKYYFQGGDWGSVIGVALMYIQPSHILGYHTNMPFGQPPMKVLQWAVASVFPSLVWDKEDFYPLVPVSQYVAYRFVEGGYLNVQSQRPDLLGYGLNNSPIGLAAYILEKYVAWTNPAYLDLDDGGFNIHFSMDDLLTNIMIYWVSGNVVSSMRYYRECNHRTLADPMTRQVTTPVGIVTFKYELCRLPEAWAKYFFKDLVSYNRVDTGGHFPVFQVPHLVAQDFREFVRKVEMRKRELA